MINARLNRIAKTLVADLESDEGMASSKVRDKRKEWSNALEQMASALSDFGDYCGWCVNFLKSNENVLRYKYVDRKNTFDKDLLKYVRESVWFKTVSKQAKEWADEVISNQSEFADEKEREYIDFTMVNIWSGVKDFLSFDLEVANKYGIDDQSWAVKIDDFQINFEKYASIAVACCDSLPEL